MKPIKPTCFFLNKTLVFASPCYWMPSSKVYLMSFHLKMKWHFCLWNFTWNDILYIFLVNDTIRLFTNSQTNETLLYGISHYASPSFRDAYSDRQLSSNSYFELWVEIFCVPTCFYMRIPKPCPSVCLSVCLSVHLSVHLSVRLSVHLSVRPSVCLSVRTPRKDIIIASSISVLN